MQETKRLPIRLAIRREGGWVIARMAAGDTMDGAIEFGRIAYFLVENNDDRFQKWRELMTEFLGDGIKQMTGEDPMFVLEPAPESERSGHA